MFWALCEFLRDLSSPSASTSKRLQRQQARTRQLIYVAMLTPTLLRGLCVCAYGMCVCACCVHTIATHKRRTLSQRAAARHTAWWTKQKCKLHAGGCNQARKCVQALLLLACLARSSAIEQGAGSQADQ